MSHFPSVLYLLTQIMSDGIMLDGSNFCQIFKNCDITEKYFFTIHDVDTLDVSYYHMDFQFCENLFFMNIFLPSDIKNVPSDIIIPTMIAQLF